MAAPLRSNAATERRPRSASRGPAAWLSATLLLTIALFGGCATTSRRARADGRLTIACNVPDARVYVDEVFLGRAADLRGRIFSIASGPRRLELRADGWFPAFRDVTVPHDGRADVQVDLRAVPANEPAE